MERVYKVPVVWEMYGHLTICANSEEEALEYAIKNIDEEDLPYDGEYVLESFKVDTDGLIIEG